MLCTDVVCSYLSLLQFWETRVIMWLVFRETGQYSSPFIQLQILNMDYPPSFFCLPRPVLVLDQLGASLHNPLVLSGLGENNMYCYKHCTSILKGLCFKISVFQENTWDKTSECSCLFISRRCDHFFQQMSLKGSEIICN